MFISIQSGRGLAAIAVAAFHLSITMGDIRYGGLAIFGNWTSRGNLGVDFFFVLSGFIILFAHYDDLGKPDRVKLYCAKRLIRVYPIYLLYTIVFSALVLLGVGSGSHLPTSWAGWISSLSLVLISTEPPPIAPAWTLFHEVAFYTLFLTLVWSRKVGALILAAWFLLILFHFEYSTDRNRSALNVYLSLHNLNFFIGMLAFLIFKKYDSHICRRVLVGGLFVFVGLVIAESVFDYKYQTSLIYALSFGCLLTGAVSIESQNKRQKLRVASIIGDSSYSIYLLHLAFQSFLLKIGLGLHWDQLIGRAGIYFFALIGSIIGGCFIYIYLERPILRVLRAQFAD